MSITYAVSDTTLLIIDPYNDFMSEGGKLFEATKGTATASGVLQGWQSAGLISVNAIIPGRSTMKWRRVPLAPKSVASCKSFR